MARTSALRRRAAAAVASCHLCRAAQQHIDVHVANGDRTRTLRAIRRPKPQHQTELHLQNRGLYARDGVPGHLYCCAVVPTAIYSAFDVGTISQSQFEGALRVKIGVAQDVSVRREAYDLCDSRVVFLRVLLRLPDSGCYKRHREYWRFMHVGSFLRIRTRVLTLLARIGEPEAQIIPLEHYHVVF
ncbi:hypothetical protein B0H16DRAFT_1730691 [Mycena metata]|uniref:Uncharacterized protein n=1 Tax=Mycena metata TaxID=1033252 RepID=A0AAD7I927_9AGAR|nr:hypothetical protein B0H16DRAFT_1730691 [Mycena metata]